MPICARALVSARGAHVDPDGRRAHARQPFAEDDQAVRRRGPEEPLVETIPFPRRLLLREQRLPGQLHPAALVHLEQLDLDDVALLDDVFGLLGAAVLQLADVEQALDARQDLDEGAEGGRALDRSFVGPADLGLGGDAPRPSPRAFSPASPPTAEMVTIPLSSIADLGARSRPGCRGSSCPWARSRRRSCRA